MDLKALILRIGKQQGYLAPKLSTQLGSIPLFCHRNHGLCLKPLCSALPQGSPSCSALRLPSPTALVACWSSPHEGQVFLDCGPSVLNWKVTLHYPLESVWTQPSYAHWQLPVCMPGEGSSM